MASCSNQVRTGVRLVSMDMTRWVHVVLVTPGGVHVFEVYRVPGSVPQDREIVFLDDHESVSLFLRGFDFVDDQAPLDHILEMLRSGARSRSPG